MHSEKGTHASEYLHIFVLSPPDTSFPNTFLRPKDAEDHDIAVLIQQALTPSVRLELLPKSTIDIFIIIIENDGIEGCVSSGSIAASVALADAGIEMLGMVMACAAVSSLSYYQLY